MNQGDSWHADIDSRNVKRWFVDFNLGLVKNAHDQSSLESIKSPTS